MTPFQTREYLVGEEILELTPERKVTTPPEEERGKIIGLSNKEKALHFNGFMITNEQGDIVFEDRKRYSQHFFPLSVLDYVRAMYNFERYHQQIPILSVDSHDVLACDFRCQDCLSTHGTNFPVRQFPVDNFKMDLGIYKRILKSIVEYSEKRGFKGVRFEQSGEGNPDYYRHRREILEHARKLGMQSVYVSTGSRISDDLAEALADNASFIRISLPGIGEAYRHYSGQNVFTFADAIKKLNRLVKERDRRVRNRDLMVGARIALREEHGTSYFDFAAGLKDMGIDSLQIVKILVPEGKKPSDFPLPYTDIRDLEKVATLDSATFNVTIPHGLDYLVYSREIGNRAEFPQQCFSAMFQPVLAGRSLFVCTKSDRMYSHNSRLGTFTNEEGELERFLSPERVERATIGIPQQCKTCSNIYDNMLLFQLQRLFRTNTQELKFYEIIK
ncbi:MAG: hypothetical protein PHH00_01380 [Candidatus Nanoarchaeia archaeon]|nr:hypothetical protein [Candidatus Nanoarchaeia archaeon]